LSDEKIAKAEVTVEQLLRESQLRVLSLKTVLSWMHVLGFKYESRKKHFYVDNHERSEVKKYRDKDFILRYLDREFRQHRWIRLLETDAQKYIDDGEISETHGYNYVQNGIEFVEYHVDHHVDFQKMGADAHAFGGLLSVRMPPGSKPVIVVGQDEAIFKQYLSMWKAWSGPGGLKAYNGSHGEGIVGVVVLNGEAKLLAVVELVTSIFREAAKIDYRRA